MTMHGGSDIRDWKMLCDQIRADLKKRLKALPLSQVNQLLILSNFATLRLKGVSQINASHEIARQWHDGKGTYFARCVCDKSYKVQRSARDEYNQVKLSFGDKGYIQYLETSTIR